MEKINNYLSQLIQQGHTEFQANIIFLKDENISSKYRKIYLDSIPNYIPPIPMDIDPEFLSNPPEHNPILKRS